MGQGGAGIGVLVRAAQSVTAAFHWYSCEAEYNYLVYLQSV